MHRAYYQTGKGVKIPLDDISALIGVGEGLHSFKWNHDTNSRSVRGMRLGLREVSVSCSARPDAADSLRRAFNADCYNETPGQIVVDDEWRMSCYIVSSELDLFTKGRVTLDLTALLLDGFWWREKSRHFVIGLTTDGLNHPYDHEYDLSFSAGKGEIAVDSAIGAPLKLTFYGPCTNPYVIIGGNRYEVDVSVQSGSTVVIDAMGDTPTVQMIDVYGNARSVFSSAVRDGGAGGGSYAFEKLPSGSNEVSWSGTFAFTVAWRERDSEWPWSR